jgi:hypothetical protein
VRSGVAPDGLVDNRLAAIASIISFAVIGSPDSASTFVAAAIYRMNDALSAFRSLRPATSRPCKEIARVIHGPTIAGLCRRNDADIDRARTSPD